METKRFGILSPIAIPENKDTHSDKVWENLTYPGETCACAARFEAFLSSVSRFLWVHVPLKKFKHRHQPPQPASNAAPRRRQAVTKWSRLNRQGPRQQPSSPRRHSRFRNVVAAWAYDETPMELLPGTRFSLGSRSRLLICEKIVSISSSDASASCAVGESVQGSQKLVGALEANSSAPAEPDDK